MLAQSTSEANVCKSQDGYTKRVVFVINGGHQTVEVKNYENHAEQARNLMQTHGLVNWKFIFDRAKTRAGCCNFTDKTISISKLFIASTSGNDGFRNTLLHEIAHALVGMDGGHGPEWKRVAIRIGCDGKRCFKNAFSECRFMVSCECGLVNVSRHKICSRLLMRKCNVCKSKLTARRKKKKGM